MSLITPKYITQDIATAAVAMATKLVLGSGIAKRGDCHVVVMVPAMKDDAPDYPDYPHYAIFAEVIYEDSFGDVGNWEHPYDNIARCKALQLWHDRNDGRAGSVPHLLFSGDTPYWGGVKREGIVVACSGVEPYFDKLISGITADCIIALAQHAYENDKQRVGLNFLL